MSLLINDSNKWAFIHIPKTGGTSLSSLLKEVEDTYSPVVHDSVRVLHEKTNFFIFTIVRNPYTRLVSAYLHENRKNNTDIQFSEFIKNSNPNSLWMLPQNYFIKSDFIKSISFIGKYENYKKDCTVILKKIGINKNIPHLNRNPIYEKHPSLNQEKYYKHFYNEEWMKDWVREQYKDDFKIFNYGMEI